MVHLGYKCDGCGVEPIRGARWACVECPAHRSVDLCRQCWNKPFRAPSHRPQHRLERIERAEARPYFADETWEDEAGEDAYNYLDPSFMPT